MADMLLELIKWVSPSIAEFILACALVMLYRQTNALHRTVNNGLTSKVNETREAVARIEGYLKGKDEK